MAKYTVKCMDKVHFDVHVDANNIEEAKQLAAHAIRYGKQRKVPVCLYDYKSVTDQYGTIVWENEE